MGARADALKRDVDRRGGPLCELHRALEGLHQVRVLEGVAVEEDTDEVGLEVGDRSLHRPEVLVGDAGVAADRRVHVLVVLDAEAAEVGGQDLRTVEPEVAHVPRARP
jgi:hypothetical protein